MAGGTASSEGAMIRLAVEGNRPALDSLLALHSPRLAAHIAFAMPSDLQAVLNVEDVLQEAFVEVCRSIRGFSAADDKAFFSWLVKIVEHQAVDLIRAARAAKRGGDWSAIDADSASLHDLLLEAGSRTSTPSSSAARHEAVAVVQSEMELLPDPYRQALHLRYFEDLPVCQIASRMGRSEMAVHLLCYRGLRRLAARMGSAARFLSWKS
jgi:RNA polymerase sigma-70 factor, ECF subfamily